MAIKKKKTPKKKIVAPKVKTFAEQFKAKHSPTAKKKKAVRKAKELGKKDALKSHCDGVRKSEGNKELKRLKKKK